jgi:hypothetical protein
MFYNNIFASVYRCYDKYEGSPRYKAASFIFIYIFASIAVLLAIIKKYFIDFSKNDNYKLILVLMGFVFLVVVWRYYTKEKVESIIIKFENKSLSERRFWGYFTVISFIFQWVLFIYFI